jgi:hypothetical protein
MCALCEVSEQVSIEINDPWDLSTLTDISKGYSSTVCIQCSNQLETARIENMIVKQNPEISPAFVKTISSDLKFEFNSLDQQFSYQLPEFDNELFTVSASGYSGLTFDRETFLLTLDPVEGDHTIYIRLRS